MKKITNIISSKNFALVLGLLGLFFVSTGVSFVGFSFLTKDGSIVNTGVDEGKGSRVDLTKPKTEACPINGKLFTKAEKDIWETRRPILAIIENHQDSRPQSGLSKADVVYEAVAEGGITRFLSVFYCGVSDNEYLIGQIRSARVYFVNLAQGYGTNPLFVHWGGANNICNNCPSDVKPKGDIDPRADAYRLLEKIGWVNGRYGSDMNGATNTGYPALFTDDRRMNLATEHQKVGSIDNLYEEAVKRDFAYEDENGVAWDKGFTSWKFIDDKPQTATAANIEFSFWDSMLDYDVNWKYDSVNNKYLRFNGGKEHVDLENNEQLSAKNVVIMFAKEEGPVDKEHHLLYTVTGKEKAIVFQNGIVIEGTWEKAIGTDSIEFLDSKNVQIPFVRGQIWIEVVPSGNSINY